MKLKSAKASFSEKEADVAIIACGVMVSQSLKAAETLAAEGIKPPWWTCTPSNRSTAI